MKTALLMLLALTSFNSFARINTSPMVDGIPDDQIATVDGKAQMVYVAGPKEMTNVKAMILKSGTTEEDGTLAIIGERVVDGQGVYFVSNPNLFITLESESNYGAETTLATNAAGSVILEFKNENRRPDRYHSKVTFAFRK